MATGTGSYAGEPQPRSRSNSEPEAPLKERMYSTWYRLRYGWCREGGAACYGGDQHCMTFPQVGSFAPAWRSGPVLSGYWGNAIISRIEKVWEVVSIAEGESTTS